MSPLNRCKKNTAAAQQKDELVLNIFFAVDKSFMLYSVKHFVLITSYSFHFLASEPKNKEERIPALETIRNT